MNKSWLTTPNYRLAKVFVGLLSLAIVLYGVFCFVNFKSCEKHCTAAGQGTVTHNHSYSSKSGKYNIWTVEFTASDGKKYTFATSSTRTKARKGDQCRVLYDPENPARAISPEAPPENGISFICSGAGIFILFNITLLVKKSG